MKQLIFLLTLMTFLTNCAELPEEGKAAAILDHAQPVAQKHAEALTGRDVNKMRRTGLELIVVVQCWAKDDKCAGPQ